MISKRDYFHSNGAFVLFSLQHCHLPARRAKRRAIQIKPFPSIQPQPLDRFVETLRQQISKWP
ncbi:hypothetical protein O6495_24185, partial [Salmonella enterica subsp. enterica]